MHTNQENIFNKEIDIPEIVQLKVEKSLLQIKEKGIQNMKDMIKIKKSHKIFKSIIVACACVALFITAGASFTLKNIKELNNRKTYSHATDNDNLTNSLSNMFSLKVYAADSPDASPDGYVTMEAGKNILVKETGLGSVLCNGENDKISYCIGTQFFCEGNNIESITYSIDNAAFQIVEIPEFSIIKDFIEYDGTLNTGTIGGIESESGEYLLTVRKHYKSFTVSYDNQLNDYTWINVCNNTDLNWNSVFSEGKTINDRVKDIDKMVKDVVITCTVNYTDGTFSNAYIKLGGAIITPDAIGIPEKDKPYAGFRYYLQ